MTVICFAQRESVTDDDVLARVGPRTISVRDLRERIDLTPWPGKDNPATVDSAKLRALHALVAEMMMSMQAVDIGLQQEASGLSALERVLSRDELYQREILNKIAVTESEIESGLERHAWKVTAQTFRMDSEENAISLVKTLQNYKGASDDSNKGILQRDTISISFADLPEAYENTIYALDSLNQFSIAFLHGYGWTVLKFVRREPNPSFVRAKFDERRHAVVQRVKKRKEQELLREYSQRAFPDKLTMDQKLFRLLADSVLSLLKKYPKDGAKEYVISQEDILELRKRLDGLLDAPFITAGNNHATLGMIVDEMNYHPIRFQSLKRSYVHETLNRALRQVADAALASEDALQLKMNRTNEVQRDLQIWVDAMQAEKVFTRLLDSLDRSGNQAENSTAVLERRAGMIDKFIAQLAEKFKVEVYPEKLKDVSITSFNMVTKRSIGFGGSMLGRPFLLQLWDWAEEWGGNKTIAP